MSIFFCYLFHMQKLKNRLLRLRTVFKLYIDGWGYKNIASYNSIYLQEEGNYAWLFNIAIG